jgi:putative salt-induced outer membrane protein
MMKRILPGALALACMVAAPSAQAEESETEVGFTGRVGFGYLASRGNTDSTGITGDAEMEYLTGGPWKYDGRFRGVFRDEDNVTTEERYEARATANRFWTEDDYLYGRLDWRKDNFGGVREEWLPSVGYGRVIIRNERHDLRGEIGAGYRFADLADGSSEEGAALSSGVTYRWQISEATEFYQTGLVQWSDDNTLLESETGLVTNLTGNLNARVSYRVRRNSDVPAGTDNSDFFTAIGLEYKF